MCAGSRVSVFKKSGARSKGKKIMNKFYAFLAFALAFAAPAANATDLDVSALVTTIGGVLAPVGLVGMAVLAVIVGIKLFKWIQRAM